MATFIFGGASFAYDRLGFDSLFTRAFQEDKQ
jgi:hypothetical protein